MTFNPLGWGLHEEDRKLTVGKGGGKQARFVTNKQGVEVRKYQSTMQRISKVSPEKARGGGKTMEVDENECLWDT